MSTSNPLPFLIRDLTIREAEDAVNDLRRLFDLVVRDDLEAGQIIHEIHQMREAWKKRLKS